MNCHFFVCLTSITMISEWHIMLWCCVPHAASVNFATVERRLQKQPVRWSEFSSWEVQMSLALFATGHENVSRFQRPGVVCEQNFWEMSRAVHLESSGDWRKQEKKKRESSLLLPELQRFPSLPQHSHLKPWWCLTLRFTFLSLLCFHVHLCFD